MAKRKEQPAEEGSPAWMATFSDLMNLLLCFFVLLFASSTTDAEKIMRIVNSFNPESYSVLEAGAVSLVEGQIISGGVTQLPGIESFLEYIGMSVEANGNNDDISASGADDGEEDRDKSIEEPDSTIGKFSDEQTESERLRTSPALGSALVSRTLTLAFCFKFEKPLKPQLYTVAKLYGNCDSAGKRSPSFDTSYIIINTALPQEN